MSRRDEALPVQAHTRARGASGGPLFNAGTINQPGGSMRSSLKTRRHAMHCRGAGHCPGGLRKLIQEVQQWRVDQHHLIRHPFHFRLFLHR